MWQAIKLWPPHLFVAASRYTEHLGQLQFYIRGTLNPVAWHREWDKTTISEAPGIPAANNIWLNHWAAVGQDLASLLCKNLLWTFSSVAVKGLMGMRGTAVMWGWKRAQLQLSIIYLLSILHPNVHIFPPPCRFSYSCTGTECWHWLSGRAGMHCFSQQPINNWNENKVH